jgi:thiol:disulfide interchange protein DsbA
MKRRDFSLQLAGLAGVAGAGSLGLVGTAAQAQGGPVEGQHYRRLGTPVPVATLPAGKKVEVVEFFWYECPHCFEFDPSLEAWVHKLPADVAFRRVPVGFSARHVATAKLFYALEALGVQESLHAKLFTAIHRARQPMVAESDMLAFVKANGVDGAKFSDAFKSFSVATKANVAKNLSNSYNVDGVPMLGIHGRFVTAPSLAGGFDRALAVADFLIDRVKRG